MTPVPLDQIGLRWRDHESALWWLGLLYRRPTKFAKALKPSKRSKQMLIGLLLLLHAFPYGVFCSLLGRSVAQGWPHGTMWLLDFLIGSGGGIGTGVLVGIIVGFVQMRLDNEINEGVALGIVTVLSLGGLGGIITASKFTLGCNAFIECGLLLGIAFGIAGWVGTAVNEGPVPKLTGIVVAGAFGIGAGILSWDYSGASHAIAYGIVCGMALFVAFFRVYYYPIHICLIWPWMRGTAYPYHPVVWDDLCLVQFEGLDRLLLSYAEKNLRPAEAEVERLISFYPSQRLQALRAQTRLVAREAGTAATLTVLNEIVAKLPQGGKGFLAQAPKIREWVNKITAQQCRLNLVDRPFFREPLARGIYLEIENFQYHIAGFDEPLASEFRNAAEHWKEIARRQLEEAQAVVSKQPTPQVFRAGDPVDREKEAFIPRDGIVGQVEQQVMLATGCPGIVLYGRRRTGKSTVLRNLEGFLPTRVMPVIVSMQDPQAFTSQQSFIQHIAAGAGSKTGIRDVPDDLSSFYDFLTKANAGLTSEGKRLLLAVDEYELIDEKIAQRVFTEDLLRTIRESIQTHRNITWIFSGSHEITELTGAPWTSYLVSARTVRVPVFKPAETRMLLTEPLKYSNLWQKGDTRRPHFEPGFWGEGGIERVHEEAGGWPHLVQLIAEAIVDLINDEEVHDVNPALFDRALERCLVTGHNVLYELMHRECSIEGEWEYLSAFRSNDEQAPPPDEAVYRSLRRRELVIEENSHWRLRVPLMARWLRERG